MVSVPLALLAGVAAFASPCFLPLVPTLVSYFLGESGRGTPASLRYVDALPARGFIDPSRLRPKSGESGALAQGCDSRVAAGHVNGRGEGRSGRGGALLNAAVFVSAFSVVFVGLWAIALVVGASVGALRAPARIAAGSILILMGLQTTGLLRISALDRAIGPNTTLSGRATLGKTALLGVVFGVGWSPCIGPVLASIIALALAAPTAFEGLGLMLVFCVGLGAPIIGLAWGLDGLSRRISWIVRQQHGIRITTGVLMLILGLLMVTGLLGPLAAVTWIRW